MNIGPCLITLLHYQLYFYTISRLKEHYFQIKISRFQLKLQRRIQNPVKHLSWSVLPKRFILDVWQGSECDPNFSRRKPRENSTPKTFDNACAEYGWKRTEISIFIQHSHTQSSSLKYSYFKRFRKFPGKHS